MAQCTKCKAFVVELREDVDGEPVLINPEPDQTNGTLVAIRGGFYYNCTPEEAAGFRAENYPLHTPHGLTCRGY